jgi:hypothetical protein
MLILAVLHAMVKALTPLMAVEPLPRQHQYFVTTFRAPRNTGVALAAAVLTALIPTPIAIATAMATAIAIAQAIPVW